MDDEEVELNLISEGVGERASPGEEIRDLLGATASGAPVTQQVSDGASEWGSTEMDRPGRPLPVIEEPRGPGAEAIGGIYGSETNEGRMRAPAPKLPPPRQDQPGAGVVTPPRRDAVRHGGIRAPETWLPHEGTRVALQIFTEAWDRDVGPDRRNIPWSPENVLIDTVTRLQRDLDDMRAESRFLWDACYADPQTCGIHVD